MKNSTAKIAKVALVVLTIVCMEFISKTFNLNENPIIAIISGVVLAVIMGNLMKVVSRKQRENAASS